MESPTTNLYNNIRSVISNYTSLAQFESSVFWSDKLFSISGLPEDGLLYAQCLYRSGQYHRASHFIVSRELHKVYLPFCLLAAKCHVDAGEFTIASEVLDAVLASDVDFRPGAGCSPSTLLGCPANRSKSDVLLLRGRILEASENPEAVNCYREALALDVYNFEAFRRLTCNSLIRGEECQELIDSLSWPPGCPEDEMLMIRFLYHSKLSSNYPEQSGTPETLPELLSPLTNNLEVLSDVANKYFANSDLRSCRKLTEAILRMEPYHMATLPAHVATLTESRDSNGLFYLAHKLVGLYPGMGFSWYAVGCYYYTLSKFETARMMLNKCVTLDPGLGAAWLLYGHAFAQEGEHDQALTQYFTSCKLMTGSHLPLLYVGLEHRITNNPKLAERFFSQALEAAPNEPCVLHEMGVDAFHNRRYELAQDRFLAALRNIRAGCQGDVVPERWESLLNNLGHVSRKLGKLDTAIGYHEDALLLSPGNPSTYAALGLVYSLQGELETAAEYLHKCLSVKRDDTFALNLLSAILESLSNKQVDFNDPNEPADLTAPFDTSDVLLHDISKLGESNIDNWPKAVPQRTLQTRKPLNESDIDVSMEIEDL